MKWINSLPRETNEHKITVFLVPTVPLVDQQSEEIANNTSLRVRGYRGDMRKACLLPTHTCFYEMMFFSRIPPYHRGRFLEEGQMDRGI